MQIKNILHFLLLLVYLSACEQQILPVPIGKDEFQVTPYGTEQSFDIATWNIEHFPKQGAVTISVLSSIIRKIDLDLIAIQEIDDESAFYNLRNSLAGYGGFVSPLPRSSLKMGIIYKQNMISITRPVQIFTSDSQNFPRPPMLCYVSVRYPDSRRFNFFLVIVHLKAFSDINSFKRRKAACLSLKHYMDTYLFFPTEADLILLGDFNDDPLDAPQDNIFTTFINDSLQYDILQTSVRDTPTFIGDQGSWIDHIIIRNTCLYQCAVDFVGAIPLDHTLPFYRDQVSDHRPVLARFYPLGENGDSGDTELPGGK